MAYSSMQALLTDAEIRPVVTTPILNTEMWLTIRAPFDPQFRRRIDALAMTSLTEAQAINTARGLLMLEPVLTGLGHPAWMLRNMLRSAREGFPAGRDRYPTVKAALEAAIQWFVDDPMLRCVAVRRDLLQRGRAMLAETA